MPNFRRNNVRNYNWRIYVCKSIDSSNRSLIVEKYVKECNLKIDRSIELVDFDKEDKLIN